MELFGEKLKEARESKNYTIEQVSRETRISVKYIHALEAEDFAAFPGETYLIGFLKSYTEYLGLDSDKYISLYKNYMIQEQPIPINELLDKKKKSAPLIVVIAPIGGIIAICAIVLLVLFFGFGQHAQPSSDTKFKNEKNVKAVKEVYDFKEEIITRWFKEGDAIKFIAGGADYKIEISKAADELEIKADNVVKKIKFGGDLLLDFNSDGKADLKIVFNDIKKEDGIILVNIGLYKITVATPVYVTEENQGDVKNDIKDPKDPKTDKPKQQEADVAIRVKEDTKTVITQAVKAEPFVVKIVFRGYCMLRYFIDGKTRDQRFFLKKDELNLDVNNNVKLWISNANLVNTSIAGKEIIMGRSGQVVTKLIHWVKDGATGKYQLEIISVY
jgi:cytoskeleton protein RodZ